MAPTGAKDAADAKSEASSDADIWDLLAGSAVPEEDAAKQAASVLVAAPAPAAAAVAGDLRAVDKQLDASCAQVACCRAPAPQPEAPVPAGAPHAGQCTAPPRRKFAGRGAGRIPQDILQDEALNHAIAEGLPSTHEFEVHKTVWRLRRSGARHVGLQLPEGLQSWATTLADIFQRFVDSVQTATILGEVTFGACCIDDLAGQAVGVDCLIHYGHSCIVPTDQTTITTLYVHVEVRISVTHLVETVRLNFAPEQRLAFMGSVQFTTATQEAVEELRREFFSEEGAGRVPQVKPLGIGETLGCTSPLVPEDTDAVVFVCDGRFHLESAMIQNPHVKGGFFRYDPFAQTLTREGFDYCDLHTSRRAAIDRATKARCVGLILGTLGRQGSIGVLEEVERVLEERHIAHFTLLLSDVSPERLQMFSSVDAWVQVACPRLSLDWGDAFASPLLTPYEAHVAFGKHTYKSVYPMDYYSNRGGPWSNYGTHNGYGGSVGEKFRHLRSRRKLAVEYEDEKSLGM